jgi:hypothetical protein
MEENKKHCDICDVDFSRTRDYDKHIKTNKHIKKAFNIDNSKCPYCDYITDDNSNMHKHIKKQHKEKKIIIEEKIEEENKKNNIPKNIIKSYLLLKEAQLTYALKLSALKCRYSRLKNRLFKDTDDVMLETRNSYNLAYLDYKNNNLKIDELLVDYPNLVNEEIPTKNIESKDDEKEDKEEISQDNQLQENKLLQDIKFEKINKIKNEIEILLEEYKKSKGDKNILNKIYDKENELKKIN